MIWTIANMQHKKGYFYYQIKKGMSSKISYMRWSNAFMFNAMAHYYLKSINKWKSESLNKVITYAPTSREELIEYAVDNKKILVAVNAEKILHATDRK